MVRVDSTMVPLGTLAPEFALADTQGWTVKLGDYALAPGLLVMFLSNHCPYVKHIRAKLAEVTGEYIDQGLAVVGINSNDVDMYPDDSPAKMAEEVITAGYRFPYLFDETQQVAHAYRAACTPDFFLFDRDRRLVYRGQFDNSRPSNGQPLTGRDLTAAVEALLAGRSVPAQQIPSAGCNIKWKPGNEPEYFRR